MMVRFILRPWKCPDLGSVLMALGLTMLLGAGCICAYNLWDESEADSRSREVLTELVPEIPSAEAEAEEPMPIPAWILNPDLEMPEIMIAGNAYIGTLEFPSIGLKLPVMSSWDYEKLKTAPCRYSGSAYRDDLVICGHNYRRHFSQIKWFMPGEEVIFTDADGNVFRYTVTDMETLNPMAVESMTAGDWDLTLFTCTTGGNSRFALRCERVELKK